MLTKSEQLLLLELLRKKKLHKDNQDIFNSRKFYDAMSKLRDNGLVDCRNNYNEKHETVYFLTERGNIRARLISFDDNTPEEYKNCSIERLVVV